jgi:hypothetical protein
VSGVHVKSLAASCVTAPNPLRQIGQGVQAVTRSGRPVAGSETAVVCIFGTVTSTSAMLREEAFDGIVRRAFDLSVQILLVPALRAECIELVVIARKGVPDVGPDAESSPLVEGELAGPADSAAADDRCVRCGLLGDTAFEFLVCRGEGEEAHNGVFQLVSVAIFLALAGLSSLNTLGGPALSRLLRLRLSCRNSVVRCPKSEESTMLAIPATRLPRQPVDARRFDCPGDEGIARGQELPIGRDLELSVVGVPRTVLGRIDVEMLRCQSFGIGRGLRVFHTESFSGCDSLRKSNGVGLPILGSRRSSHVSAERSRGEPLTYGDIWRAQTI